MVVYVSACCGDGSHHGRLVEIDAAPVLGSTLYPRPVGDVAVRSVPGLDQSRIRKPLLMRLWFGGRQRYQRLVPRYLHQAFLGGAHLGAVVAVYAPAYGFNRRSTSSLAVFAAMRLSKTRA
jgi:hypothetical protein